jgi:hypothetical protein
MYSIITIFNNVSAPLKTKQPEQKQQQQQPQNNNNNNNISSHSYHFNKISLHIKCLYFGGPHR